MNSVASLAATATTHTLMEPLLNSLHQRVKQRLPTTRAFFMNTITTQDDIANGCKYLCKKEPAFATAVALIETIPLRLRPSGFTTVLQTIVSQQLSVASAAATWKRLVACGLDNAATLLAADEQQLRSCGLSHQKIRYARALATSNIDFEALKTSSNDAVIATLIQVQGIGRWSAEIYAMFALGRADVFAAGDLALQESTRMLFALPARPTVTQMRERAATWSPWQAVAARILWSYYHVMKQREGI